MRNYFKGQGGRAIYGIVLGIISNETVFPRVPGDSGNVSTYPFPTIIKAVRQPIERIISRDPELLKEYIEAVREFEKAGVMAITTVCGFNIIFQEELTSASKVPVFSSSLLQLPLVQRIIPKGKKIGIITANGRIFNRHKNDLLSSAGLDPSTPIVIKGLEDYDGWSSIVKVKPFLDEEKIECEVVNVAKEMISENPDIGAILFECHNLPPYSKAVRDATGLPVFDFMTLVEMISTAIIQRIYTGII
ncbi:MAG: aspartate/glutamate racemase family protein [Candidatus Bathyarchaeia archaeon]